MANSQRLQSLTKEQKIAFVFLFVFALLVFGVAMLQMRNTIYSAFIIDAPEEDAFATVFQNQDILNQAIDTDQDGLTDYEEETFYLTSRYLPDTDSDGITDKEEIDLGQDPLCPEGEQCGTLLGSPDTPVGSIGLDIPSPPSPENILGAVGIDTSEQAAPDVEAIMEDPEQIRELIYRTGQLTREQLDAIDDETLLNLVKKVVPQEEEESVNDDINEEEVDPPEES